MITLSQLIEDYTASGQTMPFVDYVYARLAPVIAALEARAEIMRAKIDGLEMAARTIRAQRDAHERRLLAYILEYGDGDDGELPY